MHHHHHHHNCSHDHHHGHDHSHGHHHHHHAPKDFGRRFAIGAALNLAFVFAELGFGFFTQSLGLIADAAHNFSDVVGLLLAWGGARLALLGPTAERTYGWRGATILAALGNACLLFLATGAIIVHAIQRFQEPAAIQSGTVMWVALAGIAVNMGTAMLFWHGQKDDLNARGAFLHMAADAAVSLGVVIAAIVIGRTGWLWVDPVISLVIAAVIIAGSWGLAKEALHLSLAGVPRHVDRKAVHDYLAALPGVTEVHDLHIWAMSTTETALTAHLVRPGAGTDDDFLHQMSEELQNRFRIHHPTVQIETGAGAAACRLAPENVI